jgi:hypothetical protein
MEILGEGGPTGAAARAGLDGDHAYAAYKSPLLIFDRSEDDRATIKEYFHALDETHLERYYMASFAPAGMKELSCKSLDGAFHSSL